MIVNLVEWLSGEQTAGTTDMDSQRTGKGERLHWGPYAAQGYFKTLTLEKEGQPKRVSP